ncbi:MAG: HAD hydrolase family protein [Bacteroidales bacterium]|nr:HAD hydrolase family protein [Bacteroidales bacterium]
MKNFKEQLTNIKAFAFDVDGVLSRTVETMYPDGQPMRTANIKDGYVLQLAIKLGYKIAIITGGKTDAIYNRFSALGISDIFMGQSSKLQTYKDWRDKYNLTDEEVLYMGDDIPDIPILQTVGIPTCPNDAVIDVKTIAKYISPFNGGECCVRDVMEQVLRAQNKWGFDHTW